MKVTIVGGSGGVGASVAFNVLLRGGHDVVLVDQRPEMVSSHVMDLEQTLLQGAGRSVRGGDASDLADTDVIVMAAGAPLTVNTSRHVYVAENAAIVRDTLDALPAGWGGVLLMVTNPVDPLVTWTQRVSGFDRRRVVGYTLNDSLRLRDGVARARGVDAATVEAWVVGEHGDACVPLWDRVTVAGEPIELDADERAAAEGFLRTWYVKHVALDSGRSSTWTSGVGVARMIDALDGGDDAIWPASHVLAGEYGIDGVALSVPVTLGRGGVQRVHDWPLSDEQRAGVAHAQALVRDVSDGIDLGAAVG